jgi:hypothetical protein
LPAVWIPQTAGRFLGFSRDRQLKFSESAWFRIFIKAVKIWAHSDNFYFHFSKDQRKEPKNKFLILGRSLGFLQGPPFEEMKIKVV